MVKLYPLGKDLEGRPCIELDDGMLITEPQAFLALVKALVKKGVVSQAEIRAQL